MIKGLFPWLSLMRFCSVQAERAKTVMIIIQCLILWFLKKLKITPFGGIHLLHKKIFSEGIAQFINNELGKRSSSLGYNYSDLILSRLFIWLQKIMRY